MNLVPPTSGSPERILVFGGPGSGKSSCWQSILIATPPDVTFHVVDTDNSWRDVQYQDQFDGHRDRVQLYEPFDFGEHLNAMTQILGDKKGKVVGKGSPRDWLVIDMVDSVWSDAQTSYDDYVYRNADTWEEQMEMMVDGVEGADDPGKRWGPIKNAYEKWQKQLRRVPALGLNLLVCARQKEMKKSGGNWFREHKEHVRTFGRLGVRPAGEKTLAYDIAVNIHLRKKATGWEMEMMKDRKDEGRWGSEKVRPVGNFAMDYLLRLAGWRPQG